MNNSMIKTHIYCDFYQTLKIEYSSNQYEKKNEPNIKPGPSIDKSVVLSH